MGGTRRVHSTFATLASEEKGDVAAWGTAVSLLGLGCPVSWKVRMSVHRKMYLEKVQPWGSHIEHVQALGEGGSPLKTPPPPGAAREACLPNLHPADV